MNSLNNGLRELVSMTLIKNIQTKSSQALQGFILAHFTCTKPHILV
jgi:hypothetical protein